MYYVYYDVPAGVGRLVEYDLDPEVPKPLRTLSLGPMQDLPPYFSPYVTALDPKRRVLFMRADPTEQTELVRVDLKNFKMMETWQLGRQLPGYRVLGMTFSPEDDAVYVVGQVGRTIQVSDAPASPPTAVMSLDAATGERRWAFLVERCQHLLDSYAVGALIARSARTPALYLFCRAGDSSFTYTGQPSLVRISISEQAGPQEALVFPAEHFPISGSYFSRTATGIAAFDYHSDRFFVQSLSDETPGTWVFDGKLSAWVGFVSAPDATNSLLGLNQANGRYYMGGTSGYITVVDGRDTPVPQGQSFDVAPRQFITTDPNRGRLFVAESADAGIVYTVWKDHTPNFVPPQPLDYDALTTNIEEGSGSITDFSASVNGYGARALFVGGTSGATRSTAASDLVPQDSDRGLTVARVPLVDLRSTGASATAEAHVADALTRPQIETSINQARQDAQLDEQSEEFRWPWTPAVCLDGGGQPTSAAAPEAHGASAEVSCDLGRGTVTATSSMAGLAGSGFRVGGSDFRTDVRRTATGSVTETKARSQSIELSIPQAGSLSIAEVSASATTTAHGRPGTAKIAWERRLDGLVIRDASGVVVNRIPSCVSTPKTDGCAGVAAEINKILGTKMRVQFPRPDLVETPKGAFAAVQQTDSDFYQGRTVFNQGAAFDGESESRAVPAMQIVVFNDSSEKSRLLVQLAAIQANSLYTIAPAPDYSFGSPVPNPVPATQPSVSGNVTAPSIDIADDAGDLGTTTGDVVDPIAPSDDVDLNTASAPQEGYAYLLRSRNQAALFALMLAMFLGALGVVVKRQLLLNVLATRGKP
jgi:hypothetical protein